MALAVAYVYMQDDDVSVQLAVRAPRSTTWNQRPVLLSWSRAKPATSRCAIAISAARCGWLAGSRSSTSRVAIAYQPMARHHDSGEWWVPLTTQLCAAASS